jgi:hypothetical protein
LLYIYIIVSEHLYLVKRNIEKTLIFRYIFFRVSDNGGMEELTVKEIAEKLGINPGTAKIRLQRKGIKPIKLVGQTAIYDPSVVEQIRNVPGRGRPPKAKPEAPKKPAKK